MCTKFPNFMVRISVQDSNAFLPKISNIFLLLDEVCVMSTILIFFVMKEILFVILIVTLPLGILICPVCPEQKKTPVQIPHGFLTAILPF